MTDAAPVGPRPLSVPLFLGILIAPVVFVWFLLRRGYSNTLRAAGFTFMAFNLLIGLAHAFSF